MRAFLQPGCTCKQNGKRPIKDLKFFQKTVPVSLLAKSRFLHSHSVQINSRAISRTQRSHLLTGLVIALIFFLLYFWSKLTIAMFYAVRSQAIKNRGSRWVKNHWFVWRANKWTLIAEALFSSVPPCNSLPSVLDPGADTAPFKGHRLAGLLQNYWETRTLSGVLLWAAEVPGKNNWRKPWLCVCWKRNCFHSFKNYGTPWASYSTPLVGIWRNRRFNKEIDHTCLHAATVFLSWLVRLDSSPSSELNLSSGSKLKVLSPRPGTSLPDFMSTLKTFSW